MDFPQAKSTELMKRLLDCMEKHHQRDLCKKEIDDFGAKIFELTETRNGSNGSMSKIKSGRDVGVGMNRKEVVLPTIRSMQDIIDLDEEEVDEGDIDDIFNLEEFEDDDDDDSNNNSFNFKPEGVLEFLSKLKDFWKNSK